MDDNQEIVWYVRHGERIKKSEDLTETATSKLEELAGLFSDYKTAAVSDLKRTHNTAKALGIAELIEDKSVSYSVDEWEHVPFGGSFSDYVAAINGKSTEYIEHKHKKSTPEQMKVATDKLAKHHADLIRSYVGKADVIVGHDGRLEAAAAHLFPEYATRLGEALDNGDAVCIAKLSDKKLQKETYRPLLLVRDNKLIKV